MRKVEKSILHEIEHAKQFQKHFSSRDFLCKKSSNDWEYFLWGHNIFNKNVDSVDFSMCGYASNTTKSRLNAFLSNYIANCGIFQKNWEMFLTLDGVIYPLKSNARYKINLNNHSIIEL